LQKPAERLNLWLNNLEAISEKSAKSPWILNQVKRSLYNKHGMKPSDVPESYYNLHAKLARDRGHGDVVLSAAQKAQLAETVRKDQEKSLEPWIDFMVSPDMKMYPMWAKYWIFTGMTKLSKFNPEEGAFANRGKDTVAPYPELNREALGMVMEIILRRLDKKSLEELKDPQLLQLIQNANFGKMYGHTLRVLGGPGMGQFHTNEGRWIVYKRGSDATPLVKSLEGKNTGWCTASQGTAESQLQGGDFHVYYSLDQQGQPTTPRLAIRMQGDQIGEIRGVGKEQNFDSQIAKSTVLPAKMKEFGNNGKAYEKKDRNMRSLTDVERKNKMGLSLTKEELKFLYEVDAQIEGFGNKKDPRIEEIKSTRDAKNDYVFILDGKFTRDEISLTKEEALTKKPKVHFGDLDLGDLNSLAGVKLPEIVNGHLNLYGLTSAVGVGFPKTINGNLNLYSLTSPEGLTLPTTMNGSLDLNRLTSADGLKFPRTINGNLNMNRLTSGAGIKLPETVNGNLELGKLTSAMGLELPTTVNGHLDLVKVTSAEGLTLPKTVNGELIIGVTSVEGFTLPETLIGPLNLYNLKSAKGLKFPSGFSMGNYFGPKDF
jgi:hypothetical protein